MRHGKQLSRRMRPCDGRNGEFLPLDPGGHRRAAGFFGALRHCETAIPSPFAVGRLRAVHRLHYAGHRPRRLQGTLSDEALELSL